MNYQHTCDGMLTLECQSPVNLTFNKEQASQLVTCVAKDLFAILGIQGNNALVFCGATFSTEQLLQPSFPIQQNITQYASAAFQGALHENQVLSIGSHNNQMPEGLIPQAVTQHLVHMPFCFYTNDGQLAETFEAQLMHKGMISPPTYELLNQALNESAKVVVNHANYMTYLDLVAMMHNHYEQLGLSQVWQIIETALLDRTPKTAVETNTHNHFFLVDHLLFTPFFSWPQYSHYFPKQNHQDYINWLMAQRLSISAFEVHGLEIKSFAATEWPFDNSKICLGAFEKHSIKQSYWTEHKPLQNLEHQHPHDPVVTYYQDSQAGLVAISVQAPDKKLSVHYPVCPNGIADIEQDIKALLGEDFTSTTIDFTTAKDPLL